jgi:hypothetical protein
MLPKATVFKLRDAILRTKGLSQRAIHMEKFLCYQPQQTALNYNITPLSHDSYTCNLGFSWLQIPLKKQHLLEENLLLIRPKHTPSIYNI